MLLSLSLRVFFASMLLLIAFRCESAEVQIYIDKQPPIYAPATVNVTLFCLADEGESLVKTVSVFLNGVSIASPGCSEVPFRLENLQRGTYEIRVKATNRLNQQLPDAIEIVDVLISGDLPPTVTLAAPAGAPFIAPETIALSATASDSDGTVTQVEFYANGQPIGSDTAAPFQLNWPVTAPGTYALTAKATDNNGKARISLPVNITVEASRIAGVIDGLSLDGSGNYQLTGWACSRGSAQSIDVHLYVGGPVGTGVGIGSYRANLGSEPAVAAVCQSTGTAYRFVVPISAATRAQYPNRDIYLHGISPFGQPNDLLDRSGVYAIPGPVVFKRKYVYNFYQELCRITEPETGDTVMHYDAAGNVDWSAAGLALPVTPFCYYTDTSAEARKVTRTYDARNRLKTLRFPDTLGNQDWSYTPDGLVSQIRTTNKVGVQDAFNTYVYNERRLLSTETLTVPAWYTYALGYGYDPNGSLASQSYPSGQTVEYAPNALGQPTQVVGSGGQTYAGAISYHPNGALAHFTYGNTVVHDLQQNTRQLPRVSVDSGVINDEYRYDGNGNVAQTLDGATQGATSRTMVYDGLDRLTQATSPAFGGDGVARYSYDALDNLRTVKVGSRDHSYDYDASNRLTNVRDNTISNNPTVVGLGYDVQGNLQNRNGQTYQFDYGNRLREVTNVERYRYDGYGRRILSLELATASILSQYAASGQLMYQSNAKTLTNSDYVYLGGSLIAQRDVPNGGTTATITYQHTDALGSPVAKTNADRVVIERTRYEPYGQQIGGTLKDGPGYTGHVLDKATGLNYMQQRYYDSFLQRFLSVDPVSANGANGGNFNRYWYAANNPYRFTDPDGRCEKTTGSNICGGGGFAGSNLKTSGGAGRGGNQQSQVGVFREGSLASQMFSSPKAGEGFGGWFSRTQCSGDCSGIITEELLPAIPMEGQAFSVGKIGISAIFATRLSMAAGPSSRALGRALEAAGFARQAGDAAHHLVAGSAQGAAPARAVLQRFGIGINEASNGIFLPASSHFGVHTNAYYGSVNSLLNQATTRQEALQALQAIRQGVAAGNFP